MSKKTIPLGSTVRCLITGLTGIAVSVTQTLNGNLRYAVQPRTDDPSKHPDAWDIDQQTLEVVDEGVSHLATDTPEVKIAVGERVRDKASDFTGIAVSKTIHLNGCVYFSVVPKQRDTAVLQDAPPASYLAAERLERIDAGISQTAVVEQTRTGGPSTRALRF